uniref:Uncharacterized protein n=1 Tax=Arundo donax TaxID=35708 RepID=A0A0A9GRG9_ARUDO
MRRVRSTRCPKSSRSIPPPGSMTVAGGP